jgi:hypothetical protein
MILFLLRWIPDPNAKNSQEECLEAKIKDLTAEEPRKSRKRERPKGRHKAGIANGGIIKITLVLRVFRLIKTR